MEYIVVRLNYKSSTQISLDDFFYLTDAEFDSKYSNISLTAPRWQSSATRTYKVNSASDVFKKKIFINTLIAKLEKFNETYKELFDVERESLYRTFHIPKKSGGLRRIDAPNEQLMNALRELKMIFETYFNALHHTSAFAYVKNRSTIDAVKKHQNNKSKWFAKFDLSNFFGSTTEDYTMKMLSMVFPFSQVVKFERGRNALRKAISLAFLNGGLPQGTPISPLITNLIMIPVDYELFNMFRNYNNQKFVYTRYADDFLISSEYDFLCSDIENKIIECLENFGAPFSINKAKTRYGSSSGSNWNLGIMLNKDNQMTVGYKNKKVFAAMIHSYAMDRVNGIPWELHDIQVLEGYRNYYRMIEKDTIDKIVDKLNKKLLIDLVSMIKEDLR